MLKKIFKILLLFFVLGMILPACNDAGVDVSATVASASQIEETATPIVPLTADACVNNTRNEAECKDCCDSLDIDSASRKACRDTCPGHDFSQNVEFINFAAPSVLGTDGDYSACTSIDGQQDCKSCCDGSTELQSGDRRYCRDACNQLVDAAQPAQKPPTKQPGNEKEVKPVSQKPEANRQTYNIEQAISDKAQGMTIAFDALAFLTGDLGSDSFFPPGKVADFWGFQYLRDNDPSQMGHAGDFLTSAALNVLSILTEDQRVKLVTLAESQVDSINEYGYKRFVLMEAFRRLLEGELPTGTTGLNEVAVKTYSAELYRLDGQISFARAQLMGNLISSMDATQLAYLDSMVGNGMLAWLVVEEPSDIRGLDRDVKVAVMTYAADLFSWYAGSVDADVYFCPERHGTYFGSFYLKDVPAMGNPDYAIPTDLTGEMGEEMLSILNSDQAKWITSLVNIQKPYLLGIVDIREQVSSELRKFMTGESVDSATVLSLMEKYGEFDGTIIYNLAVNFSRVSQTLTNDQKTQLLALRKEMLGDLMYPSGAYLYSQPIPMPEIPNTDFLFK